MTDAATPPTGPGQPQAAQAQPGGEDDTSPAKGERMGTILMGVAIAGLVVLCLDVAFKGKLLAPLFSLLPAPRTTPETPDEPAPPAGG